MTGKIYKRVITTDSGEQVIEYPATVADAVVNPDTGNTVTKDLADEAAKMPSVTEPGFSVADENGNVGMKYDANGFDAAVLSEHINALITDVAKLLKTTELADGETITELKEYVDDAKPHSKTVSESGFFVSDGNGNAAMSYTENGLDAAKLSSHILSLIGSTGGGISSGDAMMIRNYIKTNWSYYFDFSATPTDGEMSYLDGKIAEVPTGGTSMLFCTDPHWSIDMHMSTGRINYLMDYVKNRLNISTGLCTGDISDNEPTRNAHSVVLSKFADEFYSVFNDGGIIAVGNHDGNDFPSTWTETDGLERDTDIYNRLVAPNAKSFVFDEEGIAKMSSIGLPTEAIPYAEAWMKLHYSCDREDIRTRFIVLETGCGSYLLNNYFTDGVLYLQYDFLADALMGTPEGYNVIVLCHCCCSTTIPVTDPSQQFPRMLSMFKAKKSVSVQVSEYAFAVDYVKNFWGATAVYDAHTYDFSSRGNIGKVLIFAGDDHFDGSFIFTDVDGHTTGSVFTEELAAKEEAVLCIKFNRDAYKGGPYVDADGNHRLEEYWTSDAGVAKGQFTYESQGDVKNNMPSMAVNSVTEDSFDVVTLTDTQVVCTRLGAGLTRTYKY